MSKKPVLRQSQILTGFGPGAMIDLPTRSVLIGGLDRWDLNSAAVKVIEEQVMTRILTDWLRQQGRLAEGARLKLYTPPAQQDGRGDAIGIEVTVFPSWFVLDHAETVHIGGELHRGRRLLQWHELDDGRGRRVYDDGGTKRDVSPLRFVGACERGHIQDIDWRRLLHGGAPCEAQMWLIERGTSANLRDLEVACECGRKLSINDATKPGRLGLCEGQMPWLPGPTRQECFVDEHRSMRTQLRLLTRSATHAYFPLTLTIISIPEEGGDRLDRAIRDHLSILIRAKSAEAIGHYREANEALELDLKGFDNETVFERIPAVAKTAERDSEANPRTREFDRLASGKPEIGANHASSWLHGETLAKKEWSKDDGSRPPIIENVVAVHRLREVMCLYGFTRFEAPPTGADAEIEEVRLATHAAPLAQETDWLPAVEQFGEGVFVKIDTTALLAWRNRAEVSARVGDLKAGWSVQRRKYSNLADPDFPDGPYYLLHSLAHALMIEIALDCGYPQSALKERIYAIPGGDGRSPRFGILIYTVAGGSQGTLGGLVGVARRIATLYGAALERQQICSNDPVCADHEPGASADERALQGAACHGCLLVPETSCERRNAYLDRALLVETMAMNMASLP